MDPLQHPRRCPNAAPGREASTDSIVRVILHVDGFGVVDCPRECLLVRPLVDAPALLCWADWARLDAADLVANLISWVRSSLRSRSRVPWTLDVTNR